MKNSSVALQISRNTSEENLKQILREITSHLETEHWISVEECYEDNSYWMPTPEEELDSFEDIGIIEINVNLSTYEKIIALTHEIGHYVLHTDPQFGSEMHKMFVESLAWYLGYKFMEDLGWIIPLEDYRTEANRSLELYTRSLNEK